MKNFRDSSVISTRKLQHSNTETPARRDRSSRQQLKAIQTVRTSSVLKAFEATAGEVPFTAASTTPEST